MSEMERALAGELNEREVDPDTESQVFIVYFYILFFLLFYFFLFF